MAHLRPSLLFRPVTISVLFVLVICFPRSSGQGTEEWTDKICSQTQDPNFCHKMFKENLPSPTTGLHGLNEVAIKLSIRRAIETHNYIAVQLDLPRRSAEKNALVTCENGYNILVQQFRQASQSLASGDYKGVVDAEAITPRAEASCETVFSIPPYPLIKVLQWSNTQMKNLINMSQVSAGFLVNQ